MKILSVEQIRKLDEYTITHEPISSVELMERASKAFVDWFVERFDTREVIATFCGMGNNGGDGLAISRLLIDQGFSVNVFVVDNTNKASTDFTINLERLGVDYVVLDSEPDLSGTSLIIDAIFGSGLSRPIEGELAKVIGYINKSTAKVVSVDIPSGLFADQYTNSEHIIRADDTVTFQLPKLAFMFPNNFKFVGDWHIVDIGLSSDFIEEAVSSFHYVTMEMCKNLLKPSSKFDHKGSNGHALIIAGAYGTIGAAIMMAKAALKAGVGLLTVNVPRCGYAIIQSSVPEAMTITDSHEEYLTEAQDIEKYDALGIGPGIGQETDTARALANILKNAVKPLVLDADALNIIASQTELMEIIPKKSILTPHLKEFERLFGVFENDFERLEKQIGIAKKYDLIVILKGAHTSIALPTGEVYFNSTGNPGMSKGGSGDVLCGILTSLLAQGYTSEMAAIFGVYLHGLAGDLARELTHEKSMVATDIIDAISEAYHMIENR